MENKDTSFKNLLEDLKRQNVKDEFKYIGTGNPLKSDILIIGKESSLIDSEQHQEEIVKNLQNWEIIKNNNYETYLGFYDPQSPYKKEGKHQILKKNNGKNHGTSTTWMNYQKLYNKIYSLKDNKEVNFLNKTFITEVNSTPSRKTKDASRDSISFRKEHILKSEFIQDFPIVIVSGVGYFEITDKKNEIEEIFDVKFTEKRYANKEKESQPYWIHWNNDKTKLLINTYQLSIGISDKLLEDVAAEIRKSGLLTNKE